MGYQYLAHHGVKGQKWGVRKYQNPDGSLTEEGKRHYGIGNKKYFTPNVKRTVALSAKSSAKATAKSAAIVGVAATAAAGALAGPGAAIYAGAAWVAAGATNTAIAASWGAMAGAHGAHKQDQQIRKAVASGEEFAIQQNIYQRKLWTL